MIKGESKINSVKMAWLQNMVCSMLYVNKAKDEIDHLLTYLLEYDWSVFKRTQ